MKSQPKQAITELDDYQKRKTYREKPEKLKFCPECKRVWELLTIGYGTVGKLVHYDDFPSYGKPRIICADCKIKNSNLNQ